MDKIIGSLVGVNGHTFDIVYDLFFTTERVIAVIIQHPADIRQTTSIWQSIFLGNAWTARMEKMKQAKNAQEKRHSLQNLTPDEMVSAHSRNFTIQYREVASAEVKRWLFQSQLRFHIASTGQIVRFNLSKKQVLEAQRLLELVSL